MSKVLVIGQLVADVVVRPVTHLPRDGEAVMVEPFVFAAGGCALNSAIVLDRLGVPVSLCGKVGADWGGRLVREMLGGSGIDLTGVTSTDAAGTTASVVLVAPDGQRSFFHHLGATAHLTIDDIPAAGLQAADVVLISGITKLESLDVSALLQRARQLGKTTVVDVDYEPSDRWRKTLDRCLPYIDIFVPSYDEALAISGQSDLRQIVECFRSRGVRWVGIKRGAEGAYIDTGDMVASVPACKVPVVDTTGAGDCWVGGFVAGYVWGWTPQRILMLANACGAMAVTAVGATAGVGGLEQAEQLMGEIKSQMVVSAEYETNG